MSAPKNKPAKQASAAEVLVKCLENEGVDYIYGNAGWDWISGGTGVDGILGDDGLLSTSRNGSTETMWGVTTANLQTVISDPGDNQSAVIYVTGELRKEADLVPFYVGNNDIAYGGRPGTERAYALLAELDTELQRAKPHLAATTTRSRG